MGATQRLAGERALAQMKRWVLCSILSVVLLEACTGIAPRRADTSAARTEAQTIVYVARRGWHIDIGFAVSDLSPPLTAIAADLTNSQYVFFGFGDRHYLVAKNKNFPSMLAALWPGAGMVLATGLAAPPEEAFGAVHVIRLLVSQGQARAAQNFVWNSLIKSNGMANFYAVGPYEGSLYYSAIPTYSAAHTCNTWLAEALRAAGLPIQSVGVVFAVQLWSQLHNLDLVTRAPPGGSVVPGPVLKSPIS